MLRGIINRVLQVIISLVILVLLTMICIGFNDNDCTIVLFAALIFVLPFIAQNPDILDYMGW